MGNTNDENEGCAHPDAPFETYALEGRQLLDRLVGLANEQGWEFLCLRTDRVQVFEVYQRGLGADAPPMLVVRAHRCGCAGVSVALNLREGLAPLYPRLREIVGDFHERMAPDPSAASLLAGRPGRRRRGGRERGLS